MKKGMFLLFFLWSIGFAQEKQSAALQQFLTQTCFENALVGVAVMDIETGTFLEKHNADLFFYPASVQKAITSATSLHLLGADFTYTTKVYYTGIIKEGVLYGDLIIKASGDPTINSNYFNKSFFNECVQFFKSNGIKTIQGKVRIENSSSHNTPQTWLYEDVANYYGVAPQLWNYKDNMFYLTMQQKGHQQHPAIIKIEPKVPYEFKMPLTCSQYVIGDHAYIMGAPFSLDREVIGQIPSGNGNFTIKGANAHPTYTFVEELKKEINIQEKTLANDSFKVAFEYQSTDLKEIIRRTQHESINLFAEALVNTLGYQFSSEYTTEVGLAVMTNYIQQKKMDLAAIHMKDGSGMSRLNAMTPAFAADWMCNHFENEDFVKSLPKAGISGTLQYLNHSAIKGKVQAKSGSAEGVVNYAGYIYQNNGKVLAFSIFVNHAYTSKNAVRRAIGIYLEQWL